MYLRGNKVKYNVTMFTKEPKLVNISWKTRNNYTDCGVFIMRHMETFKGVTTSEWKAGFKLERFDQSEQIERLREKYASKILLSDTNELKEIVEKEIGAYLKLSNEDRRTLHADAETRIQERIGSLG